VKNMFDDFMEELRRRQEAMAAGRDPDAPSGDDDSPGSGDEGDDRSDEEPEEEPVTHRPRAGGGGPGGPGGPRRPIAMRGGGPDDGAPRLPSRLRGIGIALVVFAIVAFVTLAGFVLDLITDAMWFRSVGFDAVFFTRLGTQAALFIGVAIAVLVFLGFNLWVAGRLAPPPDPERAGAMGDLAARLGEAFGVDEGRPGRRPGGRANFAGGGFGVPGGGRTIAFEPEEMPDLVPIARWALIGLAVIIALTTAASASGQWETFLLWRNQVPFAPTGAAAVVDPIFGKDVSYYLFELPFLRAVQAMANGLLIAALVLSLGRYLIAGARGGLAFTTQMRVHLAVLGGLYLLSVAVGYQLDKLELVYSTQGVATGVSFTDQSARFLAYDVLTAISAFAGAFLVIGAFTRAMWPLAAVVVVWLSASVILGSVYPGLVQRIQVGPDELNRETPYIANNINMTRVAFDLNGWQASNYSGEAPLTQTAIDNETATFQNARLWDYRPLKDTLDQLQTVRQYYDFTDVDTDRYLLQDATRQVMLSARELAPERNPRGGTWVNQRITFTHGIGVAMVPVNAATEGGQPQLIVRDLPPVSTAGAPPIKEPRIYFGERPSDWIITGARQSEFDYPVGTSTDGSTESGQTTRWTGTTGIRLDTTLSRLVFALRFRDLNLLISDQVTADSQLLFHRSIADRLPRIAPFLRYDKDPYLVVTSDGRLVYVQDAYTTSDRFPNAQWFDPADLPTTGVQTGLGGGAFNYIRNSVKIVMDAYTGQMTFYVSDPDDPIIRTYERIFPTLFTPLTQMPADLQAHLRVPEELFNVQTRTYARYHVQDPGAFYNNEDLWTVPAPAGGQSLPNEAYYVVMRMPGEESPEFLLLQPMVPSTRPNMISWVAARMDAPDYGAVRVYRFPQNTSVLGPNQIEAKIDADPIISAQTTLWNQSGSKVIRGNLIVMPIQDALIYLQPVYLQSANSAFPEFQRIVVATSRKIVWGSTLSEALNLLLAGAAGPTPTPTPTPSATPSPGPTASPGPTPTGGPGETPPAGDVAALVAYANDHFEKAQAALRAGDFATYGQEMAKVQDALRQLDALVNVSPAP
jgi:uncharacterized membrane protein (UPF0182 family)